MTVAIPYMINPEQANLQGKLGFFFGGLALVCLIWSSSAWLRPWAARMKRWISSLTGKFLHVRSKATSWRALYQRELHKFVQPTQPSWKTTTPLRHGTFKRSGQSSTTFLTGEDSQVIYRHMST
ncbi:hypothetical protein ACQKWADRAFT_312778 [Trichoderma austrokoningii]